MILIAMLKVALTKDIIMSIEFEENCSYFLLGEKL
jgi:hypothetical protein